MNKKPGFFKRLFSRRRPMPARGFEAAKINRILNDWIQQSISLDEELKGDLGILRARSRDLCQNNDYGRRFMWLLKSNTVGPTGIRLQPKIKKPGTKELDTEANDILLAAWAEFCRKENCTVTGKQSFKDVLDIFAQSLPRDGEILFKHAPGFDNPFGYALQLLEIDYLDHTYTDTRQNIKMGVKLNKWKRPVSYYLLSKHPGENVFQSAGGKHQEISASQISHEFLYERAEQTRGYPWTASALRRLHMLGQYEHSELVAARVGAAKMGFFYREDSSPYAYDDKTAKGNLISEVSPGTFEELPAGYRFDKFDIDHPNTSFEGFIKSILRGAASGLNISYISLANDLKETSYSSGRQGLLEERGFYMLIQGWLIEHVCQPVFDAWLPMAIASGKLDFNMNDIGRLSNVIWQGRRWSWIDPKNDSAANEKAITTGTNSRTRIAASQGVDIDDIFEDLARERGLADELQIDVNPKKDSNDADDKPEPKTD